MRDSRPEEPTGVNQPSGGKAPKRKPTNWAIPVLIALLVVIAWSLTR